jgi:hypothetical protein
MNMCKEVVEMRLVFYFIVECCRISEGFVGKRL